MPTRKKSTKPASRKRAKATEPAAPDVLRHGTPEGVPHAPDNKSVPKTWTRAAAEQSIKDRAFRCAGPRIPERMAQWQEHMAAGRIDDARQVVTRGIKQPDGSYVPCNEDLTKDILKLPFDGSDQERVCPKCGETNKWRQPTFDGLEAR